MNLLFHIKPTISYFNGDNEHNNYSVIKLNNKLLDVMIKDIASKKFRDWYSLNLNESVSQDPENIDNYLNFNIKKIEYISKFFV